MLKNIGWFSVPLALLAIAQRLGNYENKPLAWALAVLATILFVWFAIALLRDHKRPGPSLARLSIDEARWVCVNDDSAYFDLAAFLQDRVNHNSLKILVNNDLGDPCRKFHPELPGHSKRLIVQYSRKGSVSKMPNEWLEL